MDLVQWIAVELHKEGEGWPEGATRAVQTDYEIEWEDDDCGYVDGPCLECDGVFAWQGEWGSPERLSKEEYDDFVTENPGYAEKILARRKEVVAEIAELTKEAKKHVDRIVRLSDEVGLAVSIGFSGYGRVEPNGRDWNESRC